MHSVILGTAGHIDHGKSALVRALTGTDPDRLPEEKKRGITIDLGFADLDLGDLRVGFVDVPGHERFIRNMLAGAHGIDLVMLVIAADESVMPQTREHFDICRLLNIQRGLVVITKTDLVDDELIPLVQDEIEELVSGSFLEDAPVLNVSARTGAGLEQLRTTIRELGLSVPNRSSDFVTRLPVDRAFGMKGFGAVVTGTLVSGEIKEGDELELLPAGLRVRARGVQVHGQSVPRASPGQRTAVNLGGIDTASIERGMVLAPVARLQPVQIVDVELDVLPGAPRSLRSRARVRVHLGTSEVLARLVVLHESGGIDPGAKGFAQLRFESPVVALPDERFIIRSYSPSVTIAGGRVLDPFAHKHRRKDLAQSQSRLRELLTADRATRLTRFVETAGVAGLSVSDLARRTGWNDQTLSSALNEAESAGAIVRTEEVLVATPAFQQLSEAAIAEVLAHHKREPLSAGLARETLRERRFGHSPPELFRAVLAQLEQANKVVLEKDLVRAREHSLELSSAEQQLRDKLASIYEQAGLEGPSIDEALERAGVTVTQRAHGRKILQLLINSGALVRVQGDSLFHRKSLDSLLVKLRTYADAHEPERSIDVPAFKELAGVSRKYAIPLLEYFDSTRVTVRRGDKRLIVK
jgi:selenocysteine-specific elongation factor